MKNSTNTERKLTCPNCQNNMTEISYGNTNILIDTCGKCGGTWLDRGEFEKNN